MRYSGKTYLSDGTVSGEEPGTSTHWHVIAVDGVYSAVAGSGIDISGNTISVADESITVEKVADDLANVINGKEVKSNKKTALAGNESSNDFYPTTKAVADYARQISFAHESNESSYDDGGVYIDDATDIMKMYYVKNSYGARVGILFCVRTPGHNYGAQVKIDADGNITTRIKTKESGEADYTWKSWSPIGKNANIADDAVTIEKLQLNIRTSISNADGCALTLSRNFGINASAESTNENYHMRADGGGEPKIGYEIRRYPVSAGQIISIYCSDSEAGCKWVFKSENSGHWNVNVGNVHPNAGRWIVEVPENATYLFTSTFIGDTTSEIAIIPPSTGGYILNPCVFAYLSAQKLHVECTATARAVLGNAILNISGWSAEFTPRVNSTDALVMTKTAFSLKHVEDLTEGDCVIALVYLPQKTVVPVDKNIYANAIPIDNLYKRSNIPVYINNRRIKRYQIAPNRNSANITDFGYFYKLNNVSSTQPLMYIALNGKLVPNLNAYTTNNNSIANKTILCIGDSVTKRGWYQERLKSHESTLSFIGTQTTYYGQNGSASDGKYYCEGYSGRTAKNVLVDSTILLNDNVTRITNPFYDTAVGKCDFGYYCRTQNVNPDYVLIEFGLNETNSDEYYTAISSFIATIKAYNVNTVVYVVQPFNAIDGGDIGAANSMTAMQREACERCILESRSFTDCVLIPCWYIMVDAYDYPIANVSYGYGNINIKQASDGVHPSESVGFAKLGDQIYNYLGLENDE